MTLKRGGARGSLTTPTTGGPSPFTSSSVTFVSLEISRPPEGPLTIRTRVDGAVNGRLGLMVIGH